MFEPVHDIIMNRLETSISSQIKGDAKPVFLNNIYIYMYVE